ncbi:hypothetical protein SVAN01_05242 [Stagonosporopsis vannaccii]|nr:hypothetical protein SVAN01_05242 [Stagonosporopsis vannaccii]
MMSFKIPLAVFTVTLVNFTFASPAPGSISKNTLSTFLTQHLPTSGFASMAVAGPLPGEGYINGQVTNNCPFPIYVRQAVAQYSGVTGEPCEHFGETADIKVDPGLTYFSEKPTYFEGCGTSLKVSRNIGDTNVYQVEYSVDRRNGKVWYNLSAEDGAPFQDVDRKLYVFSVGCMAVHCAPGQQGKDPVHGCDWPLQPVCPRIGQVMATIC